MSDFGKRGIDSSTICWQTCGDSPCACCLVNTSNGSRTVTLYDTNLPDVTSEDFDKVDLTEYKWIHWEGRNAEEQVKMISTVEKFNNTAPEEQRITISVEIEKEREVLYQLFSHGDLVRVCTSSTWPLPTGTFSSFITKQATPLSSKQAARQPIPVYISHILCSSLQATPLSMPVYRPHPSLKANRPHLSPYQYAYPTPHLMPIDRPNPTPYQYADPTPHLMPIDRPHPLRASIETPPLT
uniref:Uncharacterized protein n=1 Tax=Leptobrachium leishanense TaxID=445787 RepID=A0A8C5QHM1_9ANUR